MNWKIDAENWAKLNYPIESCGLVVNINNIIKFFPCTNEATSKDNNFIISPQEYAEIEDMGDIIAIFHSHCNATSNPSTIDIYSCEKTGKKWYILGIPNMDWYELEPKQLKIPLIGREFIHGTLDCYSLLRDWYKEYMDVSLPDYQRENNWWLKGFNLYLENFENAGFIETDSLEFGTVLIMQIHSTVPNHAAIYIGDNMIIHHLYNRLSSRDIYNDTYRKRTVKMVKYVKRN